MRLIPALFLFMGSLATAASAAWHPSPGQSSNILNLYSAGGAVEFETSGDVGELKALARALMDAGSPFESQQVEFCQHSGKAHCPVFKTPLVASGFLLGEDQLVTSYHFLHQQLVWNAKGFLGKTDPHNLISALRDSDVFLQGASEQEANSFSTVKDPRLLRPEILNPSIYFLATPDTKEAFEENLFGELSDIVVFRTSFKGHDHAKLSAAATAPRPGQLVYVTGFPASAIGTPSSKVLVNPGKVVSAAEFVRQMRVHEPPQSTALRDKFLMYIDADCPKGLSGGPVLNAVGDVVGVIGGEYRRNGSRKRLCYALNLTALEDLTGFWKIVNDAALALSP